MSWITYRWRGRKYRRKKLSPGRHKGTRKLTPSWMRANTVVMIWNCNGTLYAMGVNLKRSIKVVDKRMRMLLTAFLRTMGKRWIGKSKPVTHVDITRIEYDYGRDKN
ncbi:hypothetical protein LCGC14_2219160 [marine sediment metagenome]|uniref:Uncharacterized protein n=1 Tax=marine sediment metagenome TaxID=412755 RepID=A0A0F9FP22_9ZZZZ